MSDNESDREVNAPTPGGVADGKSVADLARKWGVDDEEMEKQIEIGTDVEYEHTSDPQTARDIAMDHLQEEGIEYYTKLNQMLKQSAAWSPEDFIEKIMNAVRRGMAMGLTKDRAVEHAIMNWNLISSMQRGFEMTPEEVMEIRRRLEEGSPEQRQAQQYIALLEQYAEGQITQTELEQRLARSRR